MGLRLIIEDEEGATTIVPLGEEEVTIGREPGNTIQLTEQNVSRQHAKLTQGSDGWVIEDLDSYNGIKVNGVLVEGSVTLNEGDVVQIGDYHLALSNNVEQTTLNIERPGPAANDAAARVLPAVDLPRMASAGVLDSGQAPAFSSTSPTHDERHDHDEKEGGSKGLLILLSVVLLLGVGFLAYKFMPGGDDGGAKTTAGEPKTEPLAKTTKEPSKAVVTPPPATTDPPPPDPSAGETPPPDATAGDVPPDPSGGAVDTPPDTTPKTPKTPKPTTPKVTTPKTPKEPKVDEPKGDPKALLEDARKASLANNATQAYELAKKSYDIDKNIQALVLMGVSACKMGDVNKAKAAYKKLEPARQKQLQSVCNDRGITLE